MKRNIYLRMKGLHEACNLVLRASNWEDLLEEEEIPVREARGRVTSRALYAKRSIPTFNAAAMDGIAVKAEETFSASEFQPLRLRLGKQAFWVNTGEPLPPRTNAVIMIEDLHQTDQESVEIMAPAYPWQHVRKVGEDVTEGELLFTKGHFLEAWDLGALLAAGYLTVPVKRRPQVVIIPTGDELLFPEEAQEESLRQGKTVEFNSVVLASLIEEWGGRCEVLPIVPDNFEALKEALDQALARKPQLVAILAGSSAGSKDYTAMLIKERGELLFHGVTMMPGKPVLFGVVEGKGVFGVPGYPVSAVMAFEKLVRPVFEAMYGASLPGRPSLEAYAGRKIPSRLGVTEFVRVRVGQVAGKKVFLPLKRGAGAITTLTKAEAILTIPEHSEGVLAGEKCRLEILRPGRDLESAILVVGSHDLGLDLLAEFLKKRDYRLELSTAHVGSLSGLVAVRDGLAHIAGTHLFDPESGTFNIPYIKRYLPDTPVKLIHFAFREQGLILPPGNPKGIKSLEDLVRPEIRFVNRQPGAGTRVLLDYHLERLGLDPKEIQGYENEENTHLGVAVAVATQQADVGLGIAAAAKLLGLEFIPLFQERYDLLVRKDFFSSRAFALILEVLRDRAFRDKVAGLGGYEVSRMGELLYEA